MKFINVFTEQILQRISWFLFDNVIVQVVKKDVNCNVIVAIQKNDVFI